MDTDPKSILAALNHEFPGSDFRTCVLNHTGWDNLVAEIDGQWIFRFPKQSGYPLESELKVLAALRGKISTSIPCVEFIGRTIRCVGYKKINGAFIAEMEWATWTASQIEALAGDLARFLWECHNAISPGEAIAFGLKKEGHEDEFEKILDAVSKIGRPDMLAFSRDAIAEYLGLKEMEPIFLYDDLHTENFLVDPETRRLKGVIDFGDCMWGDPHFEFHPLYRYDNRIFEAITRHYEAISGKPLSRRRSVIYSWFDALGDVASTMNDPENGARKNAFRWLERYMNQRDEYR